jgi:hypothetical protein
MPVTPATQEVEDQEDGQIARPYLKNIQTSITKKRAGGVAQIVGPEFKLQYPTAPPHTHKEVRSVQVGKQWRESKNVQTKAGRSNQKQLGGKKKSK